MERQEMPLTDLYNEVHDMIKRDSEIVRLRGIHVEIDEAVRDAYALDEEREPQVREFEEKIASVPLPSWRDIDLGHGFHETRQGVRFTISPQARIDVLDKLLALNHYRYQQEVESGLHSKKSRTAPKKKHSGPAPSSDISSVHDDGLFPPPDVLF